MGFIDDSNTRFLHPRRKPEQTKNDDNDLSKFADGSGPINMSDLSRGRRPTKDNVSKPLGSKLNRNDGIKNLSEALSKGRR